MAIPHNNPKSDTYVEFDEHDAAMRKLPPQVAHFIEYEAAVPFNPVNVLDFKYENPFMSWHEITWRLRQTSENIHREIFGGVHPSLDPPRRVWYSGGGRGGPSKPAPE